MSTTVPTGYALQRVVGDAMRTLETLRTEHGQVIDTPDEVIAALSEEGIDVATVLRRLARAALDAKASAAAADARMEDLQARRDRFNRWEATYRGVILSVMEAILPRDKNGKLKFADPEFSLSVSPGPQKVIITEPDPKRLPDSWVTIETTRTPNKAAIKTAIEYRRALIKVMHEAGEEPPPELEGAVLSNGTTVLRILSK